MLGSLRKLQMIRVIRIIITTFSLYLGTHLFVFIVLPVVILISYIVPQRIPEFRIWFVRCLFAVVGKRVKVSGQENVEPGRRYVIVSNYPSGYAGFAMIGQFPHASIMAHSFLKKIPLLGQALHRIGAVFVKPGPAGCGRKALEICPWGDDVLPGLIIFPEGRISRDGKIHRFRRGFVHIQRQTSFDVLPVTLNGLFHFKPVGRIYADPGACPEMVIHTAVCSPAAGQMSDEELIRTVRDKISSVYFP